MYKKIKNSSFMNLFWFLITILPLFLLFIYSVNYFKDKDNIYKYDYEISSISGDYITISNLFDVSSSSSSYPSDVSANNDYNTFSINTLTNNLYISSDVLSFEKSSVYFGYSGVIGSFNYDFGDVSIRLHSDLYGDYTLTPNSFNTIPDNFLSSSVIYSFDQPINATFLPIIYYNDYNNCYIRNSYFNISFYAFYDFHNFNIGSNLVSYSFNGVNVPLKDIYSDNYSGLDFDILYLNKDFSFRNNGVWYDDGYVGLLDYKYNFVYTNDYSFDTFYSGGYLGIDGYVKISSLPDYNNMNFNPNYTYYKYNSSRGYYIFNVTESNYNSNRASLYLLDYSYDVEANFVYDIVPIEYTFSDYLLEFKNNFGNGGFLSNIFNTLVSYFNVSNIFLLIVSSYLEYLIIVSLLHLAFDFILLLPNICHKFMDKVGGERD